MQEPTTEEFLAALRKEKWFRDPVGGALVSVGDRWEITFTGSEGDEWPYTLRRKTWDGGWIPIEEFRTEEDAQAYAEREGLTGHVTDHVKPPEPGCES
jgi:hypothetical protein